MSLWFSLSLPCCILLLSKKRERQENKPCLAEYRDLELTEEVKVVFGTLSQGDRGWTQRGALLSIPQAHYLLPLSLALSFPETQVPLCLWVGPLFPVPLPSLDCSRTDNMSCLLMDKDNTTSLPVWPGCASGSRELGEGVEPERP